MRVSKKTKVIIILIFVLIGLIASITYYMEFIRFKNAFEQIYHTGFGAMYGVRVTTYNPRPPFSTCMDIFKKTEINYATYEGAGLGENRKVTFSFSGYHEGTPERLTIYFYQEFPDTGEGIYLTYSYFVETGVLTKNAIRTTQIQNDDLVYILYNNASEIDYEFLKRHGLTHEEIDELHYWFLFEHFLPHWRETTRHHTRFSPGNWGDFTFVDVPATMEIPESSNLRGIIIVTTAALLVLLTVTAIIIRRRAKKRIEEGLGE